MKKTKERTQREPSRDSLRGIPEIDFSRARVRHNPYAARIDKEGITGRGRPKRPLEVEGTRPRSVRFPDAVWQRTEARANAKGMTLRAALLAWLEAAA